MTTPIVTIDANGITRPTLEYCVNWFKDAYRQIYGTDVYLEPDSQDGQWLGIQAQGYDDVNAIAIAVYNAFSPSTAQGVGLSRVVKINGIRRKVPTYSSATVTIIGTWGTVITNGRVQDELGNFWALPETVTIPASGEIDVTATCETIGAVQAGIGTINSIYTNYPGWQSVSNAEIATVGAVVETDGELRQRQTISTMIPSKSVLDGLAGAIAAITNVTRFKIYENDASITDNNGVPPNSISVVVEGGADQTIADVIRLKKGSGAGTYGTTVVQSVDTGGVSRAIAFYKLSLVPISYRITIKKFTGFTDQIKAKIISELVDWTNAIGIGNTLLFTKAWLPANLYGDAGSETFEITSFQCSRDFFGTSDIPMAMYEAASSDASLVSITVI